jgi:hypothetical protein
MELADAPWYVCSASSITHTLTRTSKMSKAISSPGTAWHKTSCTHFQLVHSSFKTHENSSFKNSCDLLDIFDSVGWCDYALMCPKLRSSHRVRSGHLTGLAQNSCAQSHRLVSKNRVMKLKFLTTVSQVLRHRMSWVFETWAQLSSLWWFFVKSRTPLTFRSGEVIL